MAIPGKENENGVYEFPYAIKEPPKTKWESIKTGCWDPKTGQFLGRTFKSWGQIILFYIIFYIVLGALFSICMAALYSTLDDDKPKYTTDSSLIGSNPGLGFRPMPDTSEGALIYYKASDPKSQKKYIDLINEFLSEYNTTQLRHKNKFASSCGNGTKPHGTACPVNVTGFGNCSGPYYGYNTASPCVFLKLNKIYGWTPDTYKNETELPSKMSLYDQEMINATMRDNESYPDQIWVTCQGEYSADKEHVGEFEYIPKRGFPAYYYPYQHKKDEYLSPLVAVRIINLASGVPVNIECRAWAKNIEYAGGPMDQRRGSVRLEIMRDE